jgi:hypothetical protein
VNKVQAHWKKSQNASPSQGGMRFSRNGAIDDGLEAPNQFHGFEDGIPHDDTSSTEGEGEMGFREPSSFSWASFWIRPRRIVSSSGAAGASWES